MVSMVDTVWVADLRISPATAEKITREHGLSADEVNDAVKCVPGLRFTWNDHPERGRRAIVEVSIRGCRCLIVLYPRLDDAFGDAWNLGSAYPIEG
jgi:hypothetical protein